MTTEHPYWVSESLANFLGKRAYRGFDQIDEKTWTKLVRIHYPPLAHVFYVVDALKNAEEGWVQIPGEHLIEELAHNAARKRAYNDAIPHRVRIVVKDE